ncbi:MAG: hypothetical protein KDC12_05370 [Flavobacteriales bacterium]|nr:hypothetical protein [Flavobacteriales bacterium]
MEETLSRPSPFKCNVAHCSSNVGVYYMGSGGAFYNQYYGIKPNGNRGYVNRILFLLHATFIGVFTMCAPLLSAQQCEPSEFIEQHYTRISDSVLVSMALDSLRGCVTEEEGMHWDHAHHLYSPDSLWTVYQFAGESCGAYCNPFYENVIRLPNTVSGKNEFIEDWAVFDFHLDSIIVLVPFQTYLVLGTSGGRPRSFEAVWGSEARVIDLAGDIDISWSFSSTTSSLIPTDHPLCDLHYNRDTRLLTYRYDGYDWDEEGEVLHFFRAEGTWCFDGSTFQLVEDRVQDMEW